MEETTKERKRPDVVQLLKDRKGKQERVVKCSLQKALKDKQLMPEIQKWVRTVSKVTNKGSLVFNRLLIHCLQNNVPLPDLQDQTLYLQCFNIGIGQVRKSIEPLVEVWKKSFSGFPTIEKSRGDTQAYVYASKQYMTNFKNSLIYPFENRQKAFIARWCRENQLDKEQAYAIRCAINRWGCRTELNSKAIPFVEEQRKLLGTISEDEEVTHTWLGAHMENVVRYYWHILCYNEHFEDAKRFTLAPISSIKSHYLTIDTTVLFEMMKNCKLTSVKKDAFMELRDEHFSSCFRYSTLCRKGVFTHMLETDGVSVCFHFHVPKAQKVKENRVLKKSDRVIAIDPGRSNLIFAVDDTTKETYCLTRQSYYTSAGMKTMNRKAAKWEKNIEEAELVYRKQSLKTIKEEVWDLFLKDYASVYQTLWDAKTEKKWGRERFRVYNLKRKTLDNFFQTMVGDQRPVIAYGAARFNPTSKNELSAPTTFVSKRCVKHFPLIMVDEYNTTKVCYCCNQKLCPVMKNQQEVRGLRWCCSTNCRTFLNRDLNAALNIARCFRSGTCRPLSLCRNSGRSSVASKPLKIY